MTIPTEEISEILRFCEERDLGYVEIDTPDWSLRLGRGAVTNVPADTAVPVTALTETDVSVDPDKPEPDVEETVIKAPMVGVFYSTAVSDVYGTLRVGDRVKRGQVLCMIEAMDVEHLVKSDCQGKILKIIATDGTPVEYGAPLISIRCDESAEE